MTRDDFEREREDYIRSSRTERPFLARWYGIGRHPAGVLYRRGVDARKPVRAERRIRGRSRWLLPAILLVVFGIQGAVFLWAFVRGG